MKKYIAFVLVLLCAVVSHAQTNPIVPFPSPLSAPSSSGGGGSAGPTGSGAANQMTYWSAATVLTGSATFTVDDANGRFIITKNQNGITRLDVINTTSAANSVAEARFGGSSAGADYLGVGYGLPANSAPEFAQRGYISSGTSANGLSIIAGNGDTKFYNGSPPTATLNAIMTASQWQLVPGTTQKMTSNTAGFAEWYTANHGFSDLEMYSAGGTIAAPSATSNGDVLGGIFFGGYTGSAYTTRSSIQAKSTEAWGVGTTGNKIEFNTSATGASASTLGFTIGPGAAVTAAGTLTVVGNATFQAHLLSTTTSVTNAGTGTCTSVTVSGTDTRFTIQATCTAGQTTIVNFGTSYGSAPVCVLSPADANAAAGNARVTTATGTFTLTSTNTTTAAANWKILCIG